jgi:arylsulfatase
MYSLCLLAAAMMVAETAYAQPKPNILVIMGDDIGYWNISAYNLGMMGYAPNIDRLAAEGAITSSPTTMASSPAPRGARRVSPGRARCEQGFSK